MPLPGWDTKCLCIWFENVIGYLSASVEWAHHSGQPEAWKAWWYNPAARIYNFLGKDNIPFHTVIWPAELLGVGRIDEDDAHKCLNLPYDVPGNDFMTLDKAQFSKSRRRAIWLPGLLAHHAPDAVRFYVASVLPEAGDTDFSWTEFVRRPNDELVAAWGNLVHRVLTFAARQWEGHIPAPGVLRPADRTLLAQVEHGFVSIGALFEAVKLRAALRETMELVRAVNGYLAQTPWFGVINADKTVAATTVYCALRAIDSLKVLLAPFVPFSAERLPHALGYEQPLLGMQHIVIYAERQRIHKALVYDATPATGYWAPSALTPG